MTWCLKYIVEYSLRALLVAPKISHGVIELLPVLLSRLFFFSLHQAPVSLNLVDCHNWVLSRGQAIVNGTFN